MLVVYHIRNPPWKPYSTGSMPNHQLSNTTNYSLAGGIGRRNPAPVDMENLNWWRPSSINSISNGSLAHWKVKVKLASILLRVRKISQGIASSLTVELHPRIRLAALNKVQLLFRHFRQDHIFDRSYALGTNVSWCGWCGSAGFFVVGVVQTKGDVDGNGDIDGFDKNDQSLDRDPGSSVTLRSIRACSRWWKVFRWSLKNVRQRRWQVECVHNYA